MQTQTAAENESLLELPRWGGGVRSFDPVVQIGAELDPESEQFQNRFKSLNLCNFFDET